LAVVSATLATINVILGAQAADMRIVDADISDFRHAARRGRARSPETQQLIDAIAALTPGTAKAVMLEPDHTGSRIRARLTYAARVAGKRLQIVMQEDRVLFALRSSRARRRRERA